MSVIGSGGSFELVVKPRNDHYDPDADGWRDQVATLYAELNAQVDTVLWGPPVAGAKGTADQLVIDLGSAGALGAVADCLRAWLGRDQDRRIDIRWVENGVERSVTLTGAAVDAETMREIAQAAAAQLGGPSWPASTKPS